MTNSQGKKVTIATIKSFVKREKAINNLYIKTKTNFDSNSDCVMPTEDNAFHLVEETRLDSKYTLGIAGAWFVGSSRDYFTSFADSDYIGYEISNSCGTFILAMHR